jgi:exopolysaccharide production protein ExoZ
MRKLNGLQQLRGLAATAVVIFHAAAKADLDFQIGEAGVDLFFVLSGFLMVAITNEKTRPAAFLLDRLRRIAPSYWLASSVVLVGALLGLFPAIRLTWWHVVSSYLFIPSVSPSNGQIWPLLVPGWTLNYEMMFYGLFAGMVLLPSRLRVMALTGSISGLVLIGMIVQPSGPIGATYTDPMMLEFVAGAWIGVLWKRGGVWPPLLGWPLIALALTIVAASTLQAGNEARVILYGIPAVLLVLAALSFEKIGRGIADRPIAGLIGDASYSIYLWHTLAISVAAKLCSLLGLPPLLTAAAGVGVGLAAGIAIFLLVEQPLLRWLKPDRAIPVGPALASC